MPVRIEARAVQSSDGYKPTPPEYATAGSAAMDLRACINNATVIQPGARLLVKTGLALNMKDPNLVGIVASRSGLSLKHGIRVAQGIGVIDSDYHGEIAVILANDGDAPYTIEPGERIAQLMFQRVERIALDFVDEFSSTSDRGAGGFGSTGKA